MSTRIEINNYNENTKDIVFKTAYEYIQNSWLEEYYVNIQHIIDELIKNAIKSNYKLILIFLELKKIFKDKLNSIISTNEINEWVEEIIYSGENKLIQQNLKKIDSKKISQQLPILLHADYIFNGKLKNDPSYSHKDKSIDFYKKIKKLQKFFKIHTQIEFYKNPSYIHILIQNGAPILEEDYLKIIDKRNKFWEFVKENKKDKFFISNIDTSGGGQGLGYALIDSLLLDMNLKPDEHLYLVSAKRTIVLLNLPTQQVESKFL